MSAALAQAFAEELRARGMAEARPGPPGDGGRSGAERRIAGGIGAKRVDVTWATEESGLLLGISVKTINFVDRKSGNFQKNLTNRRGDMLFEAVTLHKRFPYAVLAGILCFPEDAARDDTPQRASTFLNAHQRFRLFTNRLDPQGRDEQYERFYIALHDARARPPSMRFFLAGAPALEVPAPTVFDELTELLGARNPDLYDACGGRLRRA
ncbi:MAG: hypothetical protein H6713_07265 [Myxococcales bacterium]|nr:hypothetical protein [Myxococcales bacterium]